MNVGGDFLRGALNECTGRFCNFSIVATFPSIQLPALLFVCVLFLLFVDVSSGEPKQN